jgi:hypothetical protein
MAMTISRWPGGVQCTSSMAGSDFPAASIGQTNPGDDAPPGTPGTGEDICSLCNGSGTKDGQSCKNCGGTGRVIEGVGGG